MNVSSFCLKIKICFNDYKKKLILIYIYIYINQICFVCVKKKKKIFEEKIQICFFFNKTPSLLVC